MGFLKTIFGGGAPKPGAPLETTDETLKEDVLSSDVPVLLDFWSTTCPPCKVMSGLLREIGPEYAGRAKVFKLNVEANPRSAAQFGIRSVPTLIFFKNGKAVGQQVGLAPLNALRQTLDKLIAQQS